MTTSPTVPEWITEFVPAITLKNYSFIAVNATTLASQLGLLTTQIKLHLKLQDDVILMRLAKAGHPVTMDGDKAITTDEGLEIVDETLEAFWNVFSIMRVSAELRKHLEACENTGLRWRCNEDDEVMS